MRAITSVYQFGLNVVPTEENHFYTLLYFIEVLYS